MDKVLDFMEKKTNSQGETVYTFKPILGENINQPNSCPLNFADDPEVLYVDTIEIGGHIRYLDYFATHDFRNLQKLIVLPSSDPSSTLAFGNGAFVNSSHLMVVVLHRPICFVNHGSLHWVKPFNDSKDVMFYYDVDDIQASYNEIKRWNIRAFDLRSQKKQQEKSKPNRSLKRLGLHR